jgi:nitroreductase
MNPMQPQQLIEAQQWRYATKMFDAAKKIPAPVWSALEQSLVLTPTSYGLQPYRFQLVQDDAIRAALLPKSWGQGQVADCSHYVVFTARTEMQEADVDRLIQRICVVRGVTADKLESFRGMMLKDVVHGPRGKSAHEWATRQAYIALGNFMTSCAVLGVDACPMEGIEPAAYDEILGLGGSGYATVVACAAGYRASGDKYAGLAKVRYETAELIQRR